jgi:hypothetical protein
MSQSAKKEYFIAIWERYQKATKQEKGKILDEYCKVCGYCRNYAIRKLKAGLNPPKAKAGRKPIYNAVLIKALVKLWFAMNRCCSKKLAAALPHWLKHSTVAPEIQAKLLIISPATIDRVLKPYRNKQIRGKCLTPKGGVAFVKRVIPLKPLDAQYTKPGYLQADTVGHCGDDISGYYAFSLTMTDICSTWTENRAVWTKNQHLVANAIRAIEPALPFKILGYSADNGSEVLNERIYDYFQNRPESKKVIVTRGRPYHSNDQAYVEQKNNSHVRGLFGYERLDERSLVDRMNEIYLLWNQLQNFFIPTMKCIEKKRDGAKIVKKYDKPKTPYQRILDSADVSEETKRKLQATYEKLNPFELSEEIDKKRKSFFCILKRLKQPMAA